MTRKLPGSRIACGQLKATFSNVASLLEASVRPASNNSAFKISQVIHGASWRNHKLNNQDGFNQECCNCRCKFREPSPISDTHNLIDLQATGRIGQHIFQALVARGTFCVTVLTRTNNLAQAHAGVDVKTVDYDEPASVVDALKGQEALVITMANTAPDTQQLVLVKAAADAGVRWILPNEWGSDTAHPYNQRAGVYRNKQAVRDLIDELRVSSWVAVVSNQWFEMSLSTGRYGIDINRRKVTFFDDGTAKTTTTTKLQVGRAVASLLSLPEDGSSPALSDFAHRHIYISSFLLSQRDMLGAVQRNTNSSPHQWITQSVSLKAALDSTYQALRQGDHAAALEWISASNFAPGSGSDYAATRETANKVLGLPEEDLDEATRRAIREAHLLSKK